MLRRAVLVSSRRVTALLASEAATGLDSSRPSAAAAAASLFPLLSARGKATRTEHDTFGPLEVPADK